MDFRLNRNDISELYVPEALALDERTTLASQALGYLADAWEAIDALEAGLPEELRRWDAESLMTARKGTRRAWLALSNLNHSLRIERVPKQGGRIK